MKDIIQTDLVPEPISLSRCRELLGDEAPNLSDEDVQLAEHERLKAEGTIWPFVFHRNGERIHYFRTAWRTACTAAGCPTALVHDMRRSAVRTFERAGVPRSVAMSIVGHKTESIYRRYAIVDEAMQREAADRLDAWVASPRPLERTGTVSAIAEPRRQ